MRAGRDKATDNRLPLSTTIHALSTRDRNNSLPPLHVLLSCPKCSPHDPPHHRGVRDRRMSRKTLTLSCGTPSTGTQRSSAAAQVSPRTRCVKVRHAFKIPGSRGAVGVDRRCRRLWESAKDGGLLFEYSLVLSVHARGSQTYVVRRFL